MLKKKINLWATSNLAGLFVFNLVIILLLLLRGAGYFSPFFPLTINAIIFIGMVMSIFMLGARAKIFFAIAIALWVLAALFMLVKIDVWAERSGIYVFEALALGIIVLKFDK